MGNPHGPCPHVNVVPVNDVYEPFPRPPPTPIVQTIQPQNIRPQPGLRPTRKVSGKDNLRFSFRLPIPFTGSGRQRERAAVVMENPLLPPAQTVPLVSYNQPLIPEYHLRPPVQRSYPPQPLPPPQHPPAASLVPPHEPTPPQTPNPPPPRPVQRQRVEIVEPTRVHDRRHPLHRSPSRHRHHRHHSPPHRRRDRRQHSPEPPDNRRRQEIEDERDRRMRNIEAEIARLDDQLHQNEVDRQRERNAERREAELNRLAAEEARLRAQLRRRRNDRRIALGIIVHYSDDDEDPWDRGRGGRGGAAPVGDRADAGYRVHRRSGGGDRSAPRDHEQEAFERGRPHGSGRLEGRRETARLRSGRSSSGIRIGVAGLNGLRRRNTERVVYEDNRRGNRWR